MCVYRFFFLKYNFTIFNTANAISAALGIRSLI